MRAVNQSCVMIDNLIITDLPTPNFGCKVLENFKDVVKADLPVIEYIAVCAKYFLSD